MKSRRVEEGDRWLLTQMHDPGSAGSFCAQIDIYLELAVTNWDVLDMHTRQQITVAITDICGRAFADSMRMAQLEELRRPKRRRK